GLLIAICMLLEEITEQQVKIGTILDNKTQEEYDLLIKKGGAFNGHTEYKIDIKKGDNTAAFLKFAPGLHGVEDYVLTALKIQGHFRGRNLSDALIEALFQYAELNETQFSSTVHQRKPLSAYIFHKYGFEPVEDRPQDRVDIMGRYEDTSLMVAFHHPRKAEQFERSTVCKNTKQYKIVDPQPGFTQDSVTLLTPYLLTNTLKCQQRRAYTQKRFTIQFLGR
ncbi:hypothetical protein ACFLZX_04245, partial [Nanoarchaeota archaeon]